MKHDLIFPKITQTKKQGSAQRYKQTTNLVAHVSPEVVPNAPKIVAIISLVPNPISGA